jgi:rod shape determining protein RodA
MIVLIGVINFPYQKLYDFAYPLYSLSLLLLGLVFFLGHIKLGAQRWLSLGGLTFQPSELAKITSILTLARYLSYKSASSLQPAAYIKGIWGGLIVPLLIIFVPTFLIWEQPDLGTSLMLLIIGFCILYVAGIRTKFLIWIVIMGIILLPLIWYGLRDYQRERIFVFINPHLDPLGAGYTVIQSKIAIGSGQIFGKGWLSGTQNRLNFLPERHTDFIFSSLGEEWGFCGALTLVLLYYLLIREGLKIASQTNELFGKLLVTGIVAMLSFQIVINIAMTIGMMPVVGLPLPLVSYGGSSVLVTFISIGILINVGMRRPVF